MRGWHSILGLLLLGLCFEAPCCGAAITTLGPIPYLSKADSPFPVDGSNPNFYLEDFEDGELNTPGISQGELPFYPLTQGVVSPPGLGTDSVDADDGVIDGNGQGGHSLASVFTMSDLIFPATYSFLIAFEFNQSELGFLPNAFGFVWTDGLSPGSVAMTVTTASGTQYQTPYWRNLGDDSREGTTAEDVFFGVIANEGIWRVMIRGGYTGELPFDQYIEIDHLQYGLLVPEPSGLFLGGIAIFCFALVSRVRRRKFTWAISSAFLIWCAVNAPTAQAAGPIPIIIDCPSCPEPFDPANSALTFLGPTPYLSAADSPFPVNGSNPNFYLEDFEDGELNTPGIRDDYTPYWTRIIGPSYFTASVDGDDGTIDGNGTNGHSLVSTFFTYFPTSPRVFQQRFRFSFESIHGTGKPTAFGFVWTDGPIDSTVLIQVFDADGISIQEARFHGLGDSSTVGTTDGHRFFGVIGSHPIESIEITSIFVERDPNAFRSFQIDHLQYGLLVPEPAAFGQILLCIGIIVTAKSRPS